MWYLKSKILSINEWRIVEDQGMYYILQKKKTPERKKERTEERKRKNWALEIDK